MMDTRTSEEIIHELRGQQIELEIQIKEIMKNSLVLDDSRDQYLDRFDLIQILLRNIPAPVLIHLNGIIQYVNLAISETFHYDVNEIIGSHVTKIVASSSYGMVDLMIHKGSAEEEVSPYELTFLTKNGDCRICEVRETPVCYAGEIASLIVLTDITERRYAENAFHEANQKFRFLMSLTRHDIFNHLTAVDLFHELALSEKNPNTITHSVTKAQEACSRIAHIIGFTREIDDFGRKLNGWQQIFGIIESAIPEVILGNVRIENEIPHDLVVYSDSILRKVFSTLIDNAIRHGGTLSLIRFSYKELDNMLILTCEDDGVGIPKNEKELIFTQGYGKHSGIGLFISREILSMTGLSIRESGEEGKGARFEILVPLGKYRVLS